MEVLSNIKGLWAHAPPGAAVLDGKAMVLERGKGRAKVGQKQG